MGVALVLIAGGTLWALVASRGSPTQASPAHRHGPPASQSVLDLTGPRDAQPDVRHELTARSSTIAVAGQEISALSYNGTSPGPAIRARAGQLVEVVLRNADVATGVTIHWHGLDVPNAEDGVAGVTQDAVFPGQEHTYRFRPTQVGTFWYHSHQDSAAAVARGLYGALIIDPPTGDPTSDDPTADDAMDLPLLAHTWTDRSGTPGDEIVVGTSAGVDERRVPAGRTVRLRLINTDGLPQTWVVTGAAFRVTAIDGTPVHEPGELVDTSLRLAGGGRYDVEFAMPSVPVSVRLVELNQPGVLLVPAPAESEADVAGSEADEVDPATLPAVMAGTRFDPLTYGAPVATPPLPVEAFNREVELVLDTKHGRRQGLPYVYWTINGARYPDVPTITVADGDLVRVRIVNDGTDVHPMHLHGHHVLVLSRNGVVASGSPWWTDTLGVEPGDDFVIAFRADNPGIWMDHCHNLDHAATGMMLHVAYDGVSTPFSMHHGNISE